MVTFNVFFDWSGKEMSLCTKMRRRSMAGVYSNIIICLIILVYSAFCFEENDYLAKRDKQLMGQLYRYLGLSVGLIQENMNSNQRRQNYLNSNLLLTVHPSIERELLIDFPLFKWMMFFFVIVVTTHRDVQPTTTKYGVVVDVVDDDDA